MSKDISLTQVFGVISDVPIYTYVDRQSLDIRFDHYLNSQKHIVVHGASKQGKSCLRKKNIDSSSCVLIQCLPSMKSGDAVWTAALESMGYLDVDRVSTHQVSGTNIETGAAVQARIPMIAGGDVRLKAEASNQSSQINEFSTRKGESNLGRLAKYLSEKNKRLVIEDFHYLTENARKDIAFGLKALYEEKAYVIVVGVWSEQNLLTYYNGDLTGRIEEVNLTWSEAELKKVLSKGEGALNIEFAPGIRGQMLVSSFQNVGLLQRLAEKVCIEASIFSSQPQKVVLSDIDMLARARAKIVSDVRQRYTKIAEVFKEGMRTNSILHLYARIYNVLIDAEEAELIAGISRSDLLTRIQQNSPDEIRQSDLTSALEKIERLQSSREITPLLVSYSKDQKKLFLNDREFLFYRKYSGDDIDELKVDV